MRRNCRRSSKVRIASALGLAGEKLGAQIAYSNFRLFKMNAIPNAWEIYEDCIVMMRFIPGVEHGGLGAQNTESYNRI